MRVLMSLVTVQETSESAVVDVVVISQQGDSGVQRSCSSLLLGRLRLSAAVRFLVVSNFFIFALRR